jgi:RHS repeat-associated protein
VIIGNPEIRGQEHLKKFARGYSLSFGLTCTGLVCPTFSSTASTSTNKLPSPYTYDLSGNMTNDGSNTLVYDGENHVTSATNSGASGAYVYDGNGLRVQKCLPNCTSPTTNTTYLFSGSKVIAEYLGGSPNREYVYSGAELLATVGPDAPNGGFESGLTGWTILDGNVALISNASNAHTGTNYVQISTNPGGSSDIMISSPVAVQTGDQITFGGWAYLQSGGGGALGWWIETQDSNHNALNWIEAGSPASTASWTFQTTTYTIPGGVAYVALYATAYMPSTATVIRVDDAFLSASPRYYHQDHLSNRLVTNSSGNVLEQLGTFPFGEQWYNASADKLLFTTYERDSEFANDYAQARYSVSRLARFSSPDPIAGSTGDPQSLNRYSYVRNMPVMLTDPLGLFPGGCIPVAKHSDSDKDDTSVGDSKGRGPSAWESDPGPWATPPQGNCANGNDSGGGGGTLDGIDFGDIPGGLMGNGESNDTSVVPLGDSLGFNPWVTDPFGNGWQNPTSGCDTSSGIFCGDPESSGGGLGESENSEFDLYTLGGSGSGIPTKTQAIQNARKALLDALLNDPNCISFLSGRGADALNVLKNVPITPGDLGYYQFAAETFNADPGLTPPTNPYIVVNNIGAFFLNYNATGFQASILLHELGHATGVFQPDGAMDNASLSAQLQAQNNLALQLNCGKTLTALSKQ